MKNNNLVLTQNIEKQKVSNKCIIVGAFLSLFICIISDGFFHSIDFSLNYDAVIGRILVVFIGIFSMELIFDLIS